MLGRLCCVIALCLFSCFHSAARVIERDVTDNKAILLSNAPLALHANARADSTSHHKHKLIAAVLAFPLGIFGLHRIYLGAAKATPLIYIATFGGLFGVLPFIDFTLILLCKDISIYADNPHTFMWSKKGRKK